MRRALYVLLYAMIAAVVLSEARTLFVALTERERFIAAMPGITGAWFPIVLATSAGAGINAILIGARIRWAVWLNIAIGLWSIVLLACVRAPALNAIIVFIACAATAGVPFLTWMRDSTKDRRGRER